MSLLGSYARYPPFSWAPELEHCVVDLRPASVILANHGYIPRNGHNLGAKELEMALKSVMEVVVKGRFTACEVECQKE